MNKFIEIRQLEKAAGITPMKFEDLIKADLAIYKLTLLNLISTLN